VNASRLVDAHGEIAKFLCRFTPSLFNEAATNL
jgi:hypothetical protein